MPFKSDKSDIASQIDSGILPFMTELRTALQAVAVSKKPLLKAFYEKICAFVASHADIFYREFLEKEDNDSGVWLKTIVHYLAFLSQEQARYYPAQLELLLLLLNHQCCAPDFLRDDLQAPSAASRVSAIVKDLSEISNRSARHDGKLLWPNLLSHQQIFLQSLIEQHAQSGCKEIGFTFPELVVVAINIGHLINIDLRIESVIPVTLVKALLFRLMTLLKVNEHQEKLSITIREAGLFLGGIRRLGITWLNLSVEERAACTHMVHVALQNQGLAEWRDCIALLGSLSYLKCSNQDAMFQAVLEIFYQKQSELSAWTCEYWARFFTDIAHAGFVWRELNVAFMEAVLSELEKKLRIDRDWTIDQLAALLWALGALWLTPHRADELPRVDPVLKEKYARVLSMLVQSIQESLRLTPKDQIPAFPYSRIYTIALILEQKNLLQVMDETVVNRVRQLSTSSNKSEQRAIDFLLKRLRDSQEYEIQSNVVIHGHPLDIAVMWKATREIVAGFELDGPRHFTQDGVSLMPTTSTRVRNAFLRTLKFPVAVFPTFMIYDVSPDIMYKKFKKIFDILLDRKTGYLCKEAEMRIEQIADSQREEWLNFMPYRATEDRRPSKPESAQGGIGAAAAAPPPVSCWKVLAPVRSNQSVTDEKAFPALPATTRKQPSRVVSTLFGNKDFPGLPAGSEKAQGAQQKAGKTPQTLAPCWQRHSGNRQDKASPSDRLGEPAKKFPSF